MHSPETVAFEIYLGKKKKKNGHYRSPIITIWHVDPETDGTDDSCGWFMRQRHGDPDMLKKIKKAIDFSFDSTFVSESSGTMYLTGYFTPITGAPVMSIQGIVLNMFAAASWEFFKYNRKKRSKWMNENLFEILHFAENPTDSLKDEVIGTFRRGTGENWNREESLNHFANVIYGWILRSTRKWYQHPRWHIHHWKIQVVAWQRFRMRWFDKCCICGKRGFKSAPMSDWDGTKRWHQGCDKSMKKSEPTPQNLQS